ncbi:hypothetical protein [Pontibacter harenae]|uniref:hypothetical protein n=1 Tax=Pontibacter harenae TaxID=2894083 RepID=UPI001E28A4F7|nr:hypothetical protein [Pontibacter harenae]MCC9165404.1 hypothetical protein [Pontibacter harenae]
MLEIIKSLLLSFFAVAVLLPVVRFAIRKLSPPKATAESVTADEIKYIQKQEWKLTLLYFLFATIFAVFSAGMLALVTSMIHMTGNAMYLLTPNFRALFAPGLLLGLILGLLPLRIVQQSVLGHDYQLYRKYVVNQEGHRSMRYYYLLFAILLLIGGTVAWYSTRWHVTIDEQQMHISSLLQEDKTYQLTDISSIEYLGAEGEYMITFNDQNVLNTTYLKPVELEMIAFLAQESGKRVIR